MRDCLITLANDGTAPTVSCPGYLEEHDAAQLVITLSDELKAQGISFYTLCFNPDAGLENPLNVKIVSDIISSTTSPATVEDGVLTYPLPAVLTANSRLEVQVQAHTVNENGVLQSLIKSPVIPLEFEKSITGDEEEVIGGASGFISLIYDAVSQLCAAVDSADELCVSLEQARDNGNFNGAVFTPSVSTDGTLSWTNNADFENPSDVNIKGPKGDTGDTGAQGEKGDTGAAATINGCNAVTLQSSQSVTVTQDGSSISLDFAGVPYVHELPESGTDGELCLLSLPNTVCKDDIGKRLTINETNLVAAINANSQASTSYQLSLLSGTNEVMYFFLSGLIDGSNTIGTVIVSSGDVEYNLTYVNGVVDSSQSTLTQSGQVSAAFAPPDFIVVPEYDSAVATVDNGFTGSVFFSPCKLYVYSGGWVPVDSVPYLSIAANTSARHTHANRATLDSFWCQATESQFISGIDDEYPKYNGTPLRYTTDGAVVKRVESITKGSKNYLRLTLNAQPLNLASVPDYIDIPIDNAESVTESNSDGLTLNGTELNFGIDDAMNDAHTHTNKSFLDTLKRNVPNGTPMFLSGDEIIGKTPIYDGTSLTTFNGSLFQDTFYRFGTMTSIDISSFTYSYGNGNFSIEYAFSFISGSTPTTLTLPASVKWANELTVEANKKYEISIVDNIALWTAVDWAVSE